MTTKTGVSHSLQCWLKAHVSVRPGWAAGNRVEVRWGGVEWVGVGWGGNQAGAGLVPTFCCSFKQSCFKQPLSGSPGERLHTWARMQEYLSLHRRDGAAVAMEVV